MKEFVNKLIKSFNKLPRFYSVDNGNTVSLEDVVGATKALAEEYNNDACKWEYDEFETKWQTDCGAIFTLHDDDREITHYCSCCGKKIKVVE